MTMAPYRRAFHEIITRTKSTDDKPEYGSDLREIERTAGDVYLLYLQVKHERCITFFYFLHKVVKCLSLCLPHYLETGHYISDFSKLIHYVIRFVNMKDVTVILPISSLHIYIFLVT